MTEKRDKEFIYKIAIGTSRKYVFKLSFVMGYGLSPMKCRPLIFDLWGAPTPGRIMLLFVCFFSAH